MPEQALGVGKRGDGVGPTAALPYNHLPMIAQTISTNVTTLLGAESSALMLMSWYKPLLYILPIAGWAWLVSTVYDKDAARWYLKRRAWNMLHIGMGTLAMLAPVVLSSFDVMFWISWPLMILILAVDLGAYAWARNNDDRVPADFKWSLDFSKLAARRAASKDKAAMGKSSIVLKGPAGVMPVPAAETPEYEVRVAVEQMLGKLIDIRASQVDIAPVKQNVYGAGYMVDGVRTVIDQMPQARGIAMMDLLKAVGQLDVADRRKRQMADIQFGPPAAQLANARITTHGGSSGMKMTVLFEPSRQVSIKFDDLGLLPNQKDDLQTLLQTKGVVLVAAPPDSGRTTLLYALTRKHDAYTSNVQTLETELQATVEGVRQNLFDPQQDNAEFSTTLRSILRRDPDVVMVSDVPDDATAKEIARVDSERTRVYAGMRADNPLQALFMHVKSVGDQGGAAKTLSGIIAVKLVRRLCQNCKVPFAPRPDDLKKLGLPGDTKQLFKKSGQVMVKDKPEVCPICQGLGYVGQIGIFAVHPIGPEERKLIAENDMTQLRAIFRQKKQQSLQSSGLQQVLLGNTSVEEVLRVTAEATADKPAGEKKPQTATAAPPPAKG